MGNKAEDQVVLDQLDMLLDKNLSDVEDLPEYLESVPKGFYKLKVVKRESKTVEMEDPDDKSKKKKTPIIQWTYEIVEALELEDQTIEVPKPGSRFNESIFFGDVEKGTQVVKAKFKEIAESQGIGNVKELVEFVKEGLEVCGFVKTTKDKKKEDKYYIRVENVRMA
jgi:hypothetical protein